MTTTELVRGFAELFMGRSDAVGTEAGGCKRMEVNGYTIQRHLEGDEPIGIYPMVFSLPDQEWGCWWGCVDFDVKTKGKPSWDYETETEAHDAAVDLQNVLRHVGITSWIERTRSAGRHVWVFSAGWISASTMRRALLVATSVSGTSSREVNPKQETLSEGQLGNYVRLPYPGELNRDIGKSATRVMLHSDGLVWDFNNFVGAALGCRTSPETLANIASKYKPPAPKSKIVFDETTWAHEIPLLRKLDAQGYVVWRDGPEDGDRSDGMSYLARRCKVSGMTPSEAFHVLASCPWNKYAGRADHDKRIRVTIERAWQ